MYLLHNFVGGVKKALRKTNGGSCQMLIFDDKGGVGWGEGQKNPPKPAYVIHGCSLVCLVIWNYVNISQNVISYDQTGLKTFLNLPNSDDETLCQCSNVACLASLKMSSNLQFLT